MYAMANHYSFFIPGWLRKSLIKMRTNHLIKKERKNKIRIAKIKETSELFEVAEKEAEEIIRNGRMS
jgi:hypothetical protein